ncbi:putative hydrolase [Marinibacterium anthonyi]|nr:putative hydrolase [Marinibacterium anthonyi]
MHDHFPLPDLARALLPHAFDTQDGAHDTAHLLRVWRNVERIARVEGGETRILLAATLLHDCVRVDKGSPDRPFASRMAAARAREVLVSMGWDDAAVSRVCHAIEAHSFSAGITPDSLEAKILQDGDRLDAMGHVGIARCMYLAGARGTSICHATDPAARARPLDDGAYALDHFRTKLLRLGDGMQTRTGRAMASARAATLRDFYDGLLAELGAESGADRDGA